MKAHTYSGDTVSAASAWRQSEGSALHLKIRTLLCTSLLFLAVTSRLSAQNFAVDWFTIDSGGGTSAGGVYSLTGIIGQWDEGRLASGRFTLEGGFWPGVTVPPRHAPVLRISSSGPGLAKVSWSPESPGFVLEYSDSLTAQVWRTSTTGTNNPANVAVSGSTRFYRLRDQ